MEERETAAAPDPGPSTALPLAQRNTRSSSPPALAVVGVVLCLLAAPFVLVAAAGTYGVGHAVLAEESRRARNEIDNMERKHVMARDLAGLLDELEGYLLSLHADTNGFPESLPEALPEDPYGRPIRYERRDLDHARLVSDGRDRKPDTTDDVARDVRVR